MKAKFESKINLVSCWLNPPEGSFALDSSDEKRLFWHHCREQFAAKFNQNTTRFYFCHQLNKNKDIANFLFIFESIIASNTTTPFVFSSFARTNRNNILCVIPSSFWLDCIIKRSLLTLILRCGKNFDKKKNNFDDALFGDYKECQYLKDTKSAVLRFMFGFTKHTRNLNNISAYATVQKHGWREEFFGQNESEIRRRLVLPDGEQKTNNIVGLESLWN